MVLPLKLGWRPRVAVLPSSKQTPESRATGMALGDADRGTESAEGADSKAGATGAEAETAPVGALYELPLRLKRRSKLPIVPLPFPSLTALPSSMLVLLSVGDSGPGRMVFIQPIFWPQLPLLNLF